MISKDKQEAGICSQCQKPFSKNEPLKYRSGKIFHERCFLAFINKVEGRPFPCPKCNTPKADEHDVIIDKMTMKTECEICNGRKFIKENRKAVYGKNVLFFKNKATGEIVPNGN